MKNSTIRFFAILILLVTLATGVSYGIDNNTSNNKDTKVIMIIVNRIDFNDLESMPFVSKLMDRSSIGLMNTKASGRNNEFKSYATIGWGVRSEASHGTSTFYNLDSETTQIYARRTGKTSIDDGIVNLDISKLKTLNIKGDYGATPGILGQVLKENGYKTSFIGNSDTDDVTLRAAGLIAMDFDGYIDSGNIEGNVTEKDALRPFGIRTNYKQLLSEFEEMYNDTNLIVIETGDTTRLDRYKENLYENEYDKLKSNILDDVDNFISNIAEKLDDRNTKLIIVTPYPSEIAASMGERLTPIIIHDGENKGHILYSETTRRKGIIGNVDVAPTILSYFNLESDKMTGKVLNSSLEEYNLEFIYKLNERVVNTSTQRYPVLYSFAIYEMVTSILALIIIILRNKIQKRWFKYISFLLVSNIVVPLTLLILPLFGIRSIVATYSLLISVTIGIVLLVYLISRGNSLNIILNATTLLSLSLLVDIITGQNLIKNSLLGYDPIIGARYYGIGNEYMGILIGAVLVLSTVLVQRHSINKYIPAILYTLVTIIIGFPRLGANVGGTITAVFAFLFVSIRLSNRKINLKRLIYIGLAVVVAVGIMAIIDLYFIQSKSHLAGAINQIIANGPIVIYQIIVRKIAMNLKIMGVTIWSKVLLSAIVVLGILFYRPVGHIKKISVHYPQIAIGWTGIIVACIVGFAVNDSGVVAAATSVIFLTSTILFLLINDLTH